MNRYVVSFLFDEDIDNVWLIVKQKPDWQKDCLNGIGGKIEHGETPEIAAVRELGEEAGFANNINLLNVGYMHGKNNDDRPFRVDIFTGITSQDLFTKELEEVVKVPINSVSEFAHIENVLSLIEICKYRICGKSNFSRIIMEYYE